VDRVGSAIIDFTEAVYDLGVGDEEWLLRVLECGLPVLDQGLGVAGQRYGRRPEGGPVELRAIHTFGLPEGFAEGHARALSTTDPDVLRRQMRPGCASTGSQECAEHGSPEELAHYASHVCCGKDVLYLTAADPRGSGVVIVAPLAEVTRLSPQDAQRWQMLAAHVDAGNRLRQSLQHGDDLRDERAASDLPHDAEAIFDARSLRVTDAVGRAKEPAATQRLRQAAVAVDRARGKMRKTDPEKALEIWKALVRGRWSIVDWFDSDGRRFVLAIPNEPHLTDPRGLTERESQVVAYAALGNTNKMIAYHLGLSTSRVSMLLRSAMRKLAIRTRAQLVEQMRDFEGA
jgi:DNA-binding CsgD family transcriptional regulator